MVWLLLARFVALVWLTVGVTLALFKVDFSGNSAVFVVALVSDLVLVYLLIGSIQIVLEAPRVARTIDANGEIQVRLYFGRQISFAPTEVAVVGTHRLNRWTTFHSLLEFGKDNYTIVLKDGYWFHISAGLDRAVELVDKLGAAEQ